MALRRCRDMGIRCCKHSADADLRTIRNQHKNAPHEVGRTETAGPGRTERSGYYPFSAAIPACVSTGPSSRRSIRPSSLKIRKSSSLTGDIQPAGLNIPQRPAKTNGSIEGEISERIICHSL